MPNQPVHAQAAVTDRTHPCPGCLGSKFIVGSNPPLPCFVCGGRGWLPRKRGPWPVESLEHEMKCLRCSACCVLKVLIGGQVFYTKYKCVFLDKNLGLCKIYNRRYELGPNCVPMAEALKLGIMPAGCAYVQDLRGYRAPTEVASLAQLEKAAEREAQKRS